MVEKSPTSTCPASVALFAKIVSVADVAVVRDVRVGHEEVVRADRRDAAAADRAAVDGDELAEDVVVADAQLGPLALELQVLRLGADRRLSEEAIALADGRGAFDAHVRADDRAGADGDVRADDRVRPDADVGRERGIAADDCGFCDGRA